MKRLVDGVLDAWARDRRRLPLLIRGARQVGKTYAVTALGVRSFSDMASINLEQEPRYRRCFDTLEPRAILDQIGILRGTPVEPGRTLLFIDEIQECPAAVMALRYFYEQVPDLHVIGAGSLLEFALEAERLRIPVGRIQPLFMHPLSFAEFLSAVGEEPALQASATPSVTLRAAVHEHLATDPDNPELDDGWPERARPAIELRPRLVKRWATRPYLRTGDSSKLRAIGMWPLDGRKLREISDDSVLDGVWLSDAPVEHGDRDVTGSTTHDSVAS